MNIVQASASGCQIITLTNEILKKLTQLGKDLDQVSLATVKMFREDAVEAGLTL